MGSLADVPEHKLLHKGGGKGLTHQTDLEASDLFVTHLSPAEKLLKTEKKKPTWPCWPWGRASPTQMHKLEGRKLTNDLN